MTVMQGLLEKYGIDPAKIGRLEVREEDFGRSAPTRGKKGKRGERVRVAMDANPRMNARFWQRRDC